MNNYKKIVIEIKRSILLTSDEKSAYLEKIKKLPDQLLVSILKKIRAGNKQMDGYIKIALRNDHEGKELQMLKNKLKQVKKELLVREEAAEQSDPESFLTTHINSF